MGTIEMMEAQEARQRELARREEVAAIDRKKAELSRIRTLPNIPCYRHLRDGYWFEKRVSDASRMRSIEILL